MSPTSRIYIGDCLRFALLAVCLAATDGCLTSPSHEGGGIAWFTLSKDSDKAWFQAAKDFSYELLVSDPVIFRKGKLDDATGAALQSMLDDDSITHYLEIQGKGYDDGCAQMGVVIDFAHRGISCWVPSEVTDEATMRMLDYLLQLYEKIRSS